MIDQARLAASLMLHQVRQQVEATLSDMDPNHPGLDPWEQKALLQLHQDLSDLRDQVQETNSHLLNGLMLRQDSDELGAHPETPVSGIA